MCSSMQTTNANEAIAQLSNMAVKLVLHQNMHPSEITGAISERLREEAETLPQLEVLYNDTYGGFGFSEEFDEYLPVTQETSSHKLLKMPPHRRPYMTAGPDHRINACGYIRPFGKEQANLFPFAFQVVLSYYACGIDSVIDDMRALAYRTADTEKAKRATDACGHLPEGLLKAYCLHTAEKMSCKRTYNSDQDYQFLRAIRKLGHDTEEIWAAQLHLDQDVMHCLHRRVHQVDNTEQAIIDIAHETFGLVCASGKYCRLAVTEVPQIVDWDIDEYDGKERVYIK